MRNSQRFKFPKTVLFGISVVYVFIIAFTYFSYYREPLIACAQRLLIVELIAGVIQVILNYINYHSQNKIVVLTTLFISSMILVGLLSAFFGFGIICETSPI